MIIQQARATSFGLPAVKRSTSVIPKIGISPTVRPRTSVRPAGTTARPTMSVGAYQNELIKRGITGKQLQYMVSQFQRTGDLQLPVKSDNPAIRTSAPMPIKQIDRAVENVGGATVSKGTYLGLVDPTEESFIQKNKTWLIPAGIGVGVLGLYLLTKKRK